MTQTGLGRPKLGPGRPKTALRVLLAAPETFEGSIDAEVGSIGANDSSWQVRGYSFLGSHLGPWLRASLAGRARQWAAAGTPIVLRPCSLSSGRARAHFVSGSALASLGFRV